MNPDEINAAARAREGRKMALIAILGLVVCIFPSIGAPTFTILLLLILTYGD